MDQEKENLFISFGYKQNFETLCFEHRQNGKLFTRAYIEGHNMDTLQNDIHREHDPSSWDLYNNPDQEKQIKNILSVHGKKP